MKPEVENFLKENSVEVILHKHAPVFTCEEAREHCSMVKGVACKNLFLKIKKKDIYFLFVMPDEKRADLKKIKELVDSKAVTFGKPEELMNILGLVPGSVSPFGLINDSENLVKLYVDSELWNADRVSFHPNQNDETVEVTKDMFHLIVEKLGNSYEIVEL